MKTNSLICLSAALLALNAPTFSARILPAPKADMATPAVAKTHAAAAKPAPVAVAPAFAGLTCRKARNGGVVAFDSALAISRCGAHAIPLAGGRTLYHLTTPDTLRELTIQNPGRSPWELVGKAGVVREGVAEGAFVSFDPVTGRVVGVAVYQMNRATEKEPQAVRIGDALRLRGRFLFVADAHQGRRIVRRWASEVRLSAETGSVLATR